MKVCDILVPLPRRITEGEGFYRPGWDVLVALPPAAGAAEKRAAQMVRDALAERACPGARVCGLGVKKTGFGVAFERRDTVGAPGGYTLRVGEDGACIGYADDAGARYGAATLAQLVYAFGAELPFVEIEDAPAFENRGYMLDISRGRVPRLEHLFELVDWLALLKINQLQLYVENSVRLPVFDSITTQGDVLEPEEIMRLDRYCAERGIELVPCIATFGHLYDLLRSPKWRHLSEMPEGTGEPFSWYHRMRYHILNVSDPGSIRLVRRILDEFLPLFSSKKVNICCDETFDLGKGKSSDALEEQGYASLYCGFVNQIAETLQAQGRQVMIWGDIVQRHPDAIPLLNKDVLCLNWHYYYDAGEERVRLFSDKGITQYVCPSVSGFSRFVNAYDMSFANIRELAQLGRQHGAVGLLNTDWGDASHVNMPALARPGIAYGAAMAWNPGDDRQDTALDAALDMACFGRKAAGITTALRELSRQDLIIAESIWFFRDYKVLGLEYHVFGLCLYDGVKEKMMAADAGALADAVEKSEAIARQLWQGGVDNTLRGELVLAARAVALMQAAALAFKRHEYGQDVRLVYPPEVLAGMLGHWLRDYTAAWRKSSRESELWRVRQVISQLCDILRGYGEGEGAAHGPG
ncbi:beta-N-acetylhexosaminidase [Ruminococcaceae bacterium OttesenSCG-928-D13]|nr:beta-N-acetylhexosaminidase [Ruminococcaceae bacterium OttesenSCG-928-D13]